jgi:hypothetical protein
VGFAWVGWVIVLVVMDAIAYAFMLVYAELSRTGRIRDDNRTAPTNTDASRREEPQAVDAGLPVATPAYVMATSGKLKNAPVQTKTTVEVMPDGGKKTTVETIYADGSTEVVEKWKHTV